MSTTETQSTHVGEGGTWLEVAEAGSTGGIRFLVWLVTVFGRTMGRAFLVPLVFWYVLSRRSLRTDTRRFLRRVGEPHGFGRVYRQVLRFGQVALDRVFFLRGRRGDLDVTLHGHEHLEDAIAGGRGAILLGAHLGSFEAMRFASVEREIPIHVVMNTSNARMAQAVLSQLDRQGPVRILDASDGVGFVLGLRDRVERGDVVAILADRVDRDERAVESTFLGVPARFPTGPFLAAAALRCPVFLTFGLYRGGRRYDLYCEPFADPVELPRADREPALREHVDRYVERLEHYCREAPDNWFNFFDFWRRDDV